MEFKLLNHSFFRSIESFFNPMVCRLLIGSMLTPTAFYLNLEFNRKNEGFVFIENNFVKLQKSTGALRNNFSASRKRQLFLLHWSPWRRPVYRSNSTFRLLESGFYCARRLVCFDFLGIVCLFLKTKSLPQLNIFLLSRRVLTISN